MRGSPPLRFLAIVLGGWAAWRTALLAPPWPAPPAGAVPAIAGTRATAPLPKAQHSPPRSAAVGPADERRSSAVAAILPPARLPPLRRDGGATPFVARLGLGATRPAVIEAAPFPMQSHAPPPGTLASAAAGRWALSAWTFVRRGDGAALAAGGLLGGSQAGTRLTYRVNRDPERPLALSLRLSSPLGDRAGAEAAVGVDWRPVRDLPVHLLAERRQALGRDGRSAFALTVHGGVSETRLGRLRLDAYAQVGLAGVRSRDPFGDGSVRLSLPLGGGLRAGAGAWAAAQPGLSRLDLGPQARLSLPVAGRTVAVAADWRVRVAGNARPASGPTLTLATDF